MSPQVWGSDDRSPLTLIVEPEHTGHHLSYVRILADWCHSQGRRVAVLTTAMAVESFQWNVHLAENAPEVVLCPPSAFILSEVAQMATDLGASLTILPDGDQYLLPTFLSGWSGSGELSLLVMRADGQGRDTRWLAKVRGAAKKALAWNAGLRSSVRVSALRSPLVTRRGPLRWAPDPVVLDCEVEGILKMRGRLEAYGPRYWIGIFGAITARKNLPLIVRAILDQPDVGLLIMGSIDVQVAEAITPLLEEFSAAGGQVLRLPGVWTNAEFDCAISAVDCVVVAHSNEGPSGIVLKAAVSGRRLVLAGAKSLKRDAAYLGEQATWCPLEVSALSNAIRQAKRLQEPGSTVSLSTEGFLAALT